MLAGNEGGPVAWTVVAANQLVSKSQVIHFEALMTEWHGGGDEFGNGNIKQKQ